MLQIKNLAKSYKQKQLLHDFSLEARRGEVCILLGASGAGKSTLLRLLSGLEGYEKGEIMLDGTPLIAKHTVGMVFQHFNLFEHLSVLENITLALTKVQKKQKSEALKLAEAELARYGLLEQAHNSVKTLSGGQKQRLSLARTCAMQPEIICLDEPTSALDPRLTQEVAGYIDAFAKQGKIVLMTTHDTGLLAQLDARLFLLQNGQIVESCVSDARHTSPEIARFLA